MSSKPERDAFTKREWKLLESLRTPRQVQRWLSSLPYNWERKGETLRSFREVMKRGKAHCLEAALAAAVILEQHNYPPLLMSLESQDLLDHVIFIFQQKGQWGAVARSRDIGLHGRKPVFNTLRQLAASYFDPYVDFTARITGYGPANLYDLGNYDWRFSPNNVWKVERWLCEIPHYDIGSTETRYQKLLSRFREFRSQHPTGAPDYFENRHQWML